MQPDSASPACSASLPAPATTAGHPELTWYINPDAGGQAAVAETCTTDDYTITTQVLPQDANQQRIQLARRLAADDPDIDLMSIDPPYTAEFANAGYLAEIPQDMQDDAQASSRSRARPTPPPGTTSWWSRRSGPTPRCSGTASRSSRRPAST